MSTALVLLADGFEELEAVTIIDVLRRAGVSVTSASLGGKVVQGSHAIRIEADALFEDVFVDTFDALVLPGGPASRTLREDARVQDTIRRMAVTGKVVAAVCAAPTALDTAGVLTGRRATAYPGERLATALYVEDRVVEDGNFVTSRGPGTSLDFALTLVAKLEGKARAQATAERLLATNFTT